jgi:hypothetical protein
MTELQIIVHQLHRQVFVVVAALDSLFLPEDLGLACLCGPRNLAPAGRHVMHVRMLEGVRCSRTLSHADAAMATLLHLHPNSSGHVWHVTQGA